MLVRECARRILDLSKEKEKLKLERREAKKLRNKIVGAGNTMDSYGDKFISMTGGYRNKNSNKPNYSGSVSIYLIKKLIFNIFKNRKKGYLDKLRLICRTRE